MPIRKPRLAAALTANSAVSTDANDLAGLQPPATEQRRRCDRTPATATGGIDEAGEQAERSQEPDGESLLQLWPDADDKADDDVEAQQRQDRPT